MKNLLSLVILSVALSLVVSFIGCSDGSNGSGRIGNDTLDINDTSGTSVVGGEKWDGTKDYSWYLKDTSKTEFILTTPSQLGGFMDLVNERLVNDRYTTFQNKTIKLGNDMNLGSRFWKPIIGFNGTFDGNGKIIKGLYVQESDSGGFFRNVSSGSTIKNLSLDDVFICCYPSSRTGAFAAKNAGTIENCYTSGYLSISATMYEQVMVSGFLFDNTGTIKNCHTSVAVGRGMYKAAFVTLNTGKIIDCSALNTGSEFVTEDHNNGIVEGCWLENEDGTKIPVN